MERQSYITINTGEFADLAKSKIKGPLFMLNLVKYKINVPETGLSGKESYKEYMRQATPFFLKANAAVLFYGSPEHMLIGPEEGREWDDVLLVKYNSVSDFMTMITTEGYPAQLRQQALVDSRLMHCTAHETSST